MSLPSLSLSLIFFFIRPSDFFVYSVLACLFTSIVSNSGSLWSEAVTES